MYDKCSVLYMEMGFLFSLTLWPTMVLFIAAQQEFLSINSGAVKSSIDPQTQIKWVPDEGYISSGYNAMVLGFNASNEVTTLRYFPNNTKNCYVFPVEKNQKYFLRNSFLYGNYDGRNYWPSFDLIFSTATHKLKYKLENKNFSINSIVSDTLFFISKDSNSISLCLSSRNLKKDVPFISSLELRHVKMDMYSQISSDLFHLWGHINLGANATLRYPDDPYDRVWDPATPANVISITSDLSVANFSAKFGHSTFNQVPSKVLMSAIQPLNLSPFNYTINLGVTSRGVYAILYFTHFESTNDQRAFYVDCYLNGVSTNGKFELKFPTVLSVSYYPSFNAEIARLSSPAMLTIFLTPTSESTLPPLLNAVEIFLADSGAISKKRNILMLAYLLILPTLCLFTV